MSNTPFDKRNRLFDCFGQALELFSGVRAAEDFKYGEGFFEKTRDCSGVGRGGQGKMWGCLCKVGCGVFRLPWNLFAASDTVAANASWLCGCKQVLGKWAKIEAA